MGRRRQRAEIPDDVRQRIEVRITRDFIFSLFGLAMLAYETLSGQDRLYIIAAALTLCGLPFALLADRLRQNGNGKGERGSAS